MKKTLLLLAAALFVHVGLPKSQAANVSVDFFYDQLGDYGDWVEVGDYGYAWQPRDVDPDWRPYSDGRWAYTEAGWTWLSDEPYGWAVYHYGRWARLEDRGWVWVPGTEWAPAWVSWRRSPKHVGWAPLPPEASFRRTVGLSNWVDSYYDIGPSAYRFVEVRNFGAPRLRTVFVQPRENITILRQTTNITRITYVNNAVFNEGPRYEEISRESAEPVRRLRLERRVEVEGDNRSFRGEQLRTRVEGDSVRVFAPGFNARTESVAPPRRLAARVENVRINRGWQDAGPAAEVEQLRTRVRTEAKAPKELPAQPKFERLAEQTSAAVPTAAAATSPGATTAPASTSATTATPGSDPATAASPAAGRAGAPAMAPAPTAAATTEAPTEPATAVPPTGTPKGKGKRQAQQPAAPGSPATAATTETKPAAAVPPEAAPAGEAPMKKAGKNAKRGKTPESAVSATPTPEAMKSETKPGKAAATETDAVAPERANGKRRTPEMPAPTPVDPVDPPAPKGKKERAAREGVANPMPDRPAAPEAAPRREAPPETAPRREAPPETERRSAPEAAPEPRKPKMERPEAAPAPREVERPQPKAERNAPPAAAPEGAPREEKKPEGGKGKNRNKPESEAAKPQ